jgi:recombination protein RecT
MSIQTAKNGQLVTTTQNQPSSIESILKGKGMRSALAMALPKHVTADRMARVALTAISRNPDLTKCTQESFFGSLLSAAQLGLEPNTPLGLAYLIPYKRECTLIVGYQGMIDLAWRAGTSIRGNLVREGDEFDVEYGLTQRLYHRPALDPERESRPVTYVYTIGTLGNGREPVFTILSRSEVEKFRSRSFSAKNGPWVTDWDAMAQKTGVRRLFKWLPKSIEVQRALELDEAQDMGNQRDAYDASVVEAMSSLQLQPPQVETQTSDAQQSALERDSLPEKRMREPGED